MSSRNGKQRQDKSAPKTTPPRKSRKKTSPPPAAPPAPPPAPPPLSGGVVLSSLKELAPLVPPSLDTQGGVDLACGPTEHGKKHHAGLADVPGPAYRASPWL